MQINAKILSPHKPRASTYARVCVRLCVFLDVYVCVCMHISPHVFCVYVFFVCVCVCVCVCVNVCVCECVCVCVRACVCLCVSLLMCAQTKKSEHLHSPFPNLYGAQPMLRYTNTLT